MYDVEYWSFLVQVLMHTYAHAHVHKATVVFSAKLQRKKVAYPFLIMFSFRRMKFNRVLNDIHKHQFNISNSSPFIDAYPHINN